MWGGCYESWDVMWEDAMRHGGYVVRVLSGMWGMWGGCTNSSALSVYITIL